MPLSIIIDSKGDILTKLDRIKNNAMGVGAREAAAFRMTNEVREHLYRKDNAEPNKLGGERTHFYERAGDSANFRVSASAITINLSQRGIRQRYKGGKIEPGEGKDFLTVPIHPDAHGKRSREFNLSFVYRKKAGRGLTIFLAKETSAGEFEFYYVLTPEIIQDGDSSVLPRSGQVTRAGASAIEDYVIAQERIAQRN